MNRKISGAVSLVALAALGACGRGDTAYDSTAGATAGAMATPPSPYGATTTAGSTTSVGGTTTVRTDTTVTTKTTSKTKTP